MPDSRTISKHKIIPVFIPHKGCPFDCIYCNQKVISGQTKDVTEAEARNVIEASLKTIIPGAKVEIAFFGGSFTGVQKALQIQLLQTANEYIKNGQVDSIRISTRPDYINKEILDYLKEFNVNTIELGVQSLDEQVLKTSCRGHGVNEVITSSRLIKSFGITLGIQTMIGLPEDTSEKDIFTAKRVIELRPEIVRIYPTLVIRNTYLEKMYSQGIYTPYTLEQAVEICAQLLDLYENENINVIRTGLQATDNISEGADVIAGPYHPAFGQMVESRRMLKTIEEKIKSSSKITDTITIYSAPGKISDIVGQKKSNVLYLKEKYKFRNIYVKEADLMNQNTIIEFK